MIIFDNNDETHSIKWHEKFVELIDKKPESVEYAGIKRI